MPPDSTNPSPTREVRSWKLWRRVYGQENCGPWMLGEPGHPLAPAEGTEVVEVMPVEDHQHLLQAEVEKREAVEDALEAAEALVHRLEDRCADRLEERNKAIESEVLAHAWLSSVEAELERRANSEELVYTTNRQGARDALQLLRDKGTEQGGGDGQ